MLYYMPNVIYFTHLYFFKKSVPVIRPCFIILLNKWTGITRITTHPGI